MSHGKRGPNGGIVDIDDPVEVFTIRRPSEFATDLEWAEELHEQLFWAEERAREAEWALDRITAAVSDWQAEKAKIDSDPDAPRKEQQ